MNRASSVTGRRCGAALALMAMAIELAGCGGSTGSAGGGSAVGPLPQGPSPTSFGQAPSPTPLATLPASGGGGYNPAAPTATAGLDGRDSSSGPVPSSSPAAPGQRSPFEQEVDRYMLEAVNRVRAQNGAGPLRIDPRLADAAWAHAFDMFTRAYTDHENPEGEWPWHRAQKAGFPVPSGNPTDSVNENVADLFRRDDPRQLAETAVEMYRQSDGHWRNLLDPKWELVGFATVFRPEQSRPDSYGEPMIPNAQLFGTLTPRPS